MATVKARHVRLLIREATEVPTLEEFRVLAPLANIRALSPAEPARKPVRTGSDISTE